MDHILDMKKVIIGCDPGTNGAFVVMSYDGDIVEVLKTPATISDFKKTTMRLAASYDIRMVVKEKIHSRPTNGAKANFTLGMNIGILETCLIFSGIPFTDITPQTWMKTYMLKKEKSETNTQWKNRLKDKALRMFPKQRVTLWNADAILIAEYCRVNYADNA
jgi:hypothetical protein